MALKLAGKGVANYPYAVARVAAKRAKLLAPADYEKALNMDVAEITRFIQDSAYKAEVDELASKFQGLDLLEAALTVNEERTYEQVRRLVGGPGGAIINLFLDRYHYDDIKTLLRGKAGGASRDELLREMVLEDQATYDLFAPLLAEDVKTVADVVAALQLQRGQAREWAGILQKVPAGSSLAAYEDALDKGYYHRLLSGLSESGEKGSDALVDFVRREIDARNLLNAARWVAAGEQGDFAPYAIPGGRHLGIGDVVALARSPTLAAFAEAAAATRIGADVAGALEAAGRSGKLGNLQAAVWRAHLADVDRLGHTHPLSLLPILLFLLRKHREVVTLRAIARGKAAGLSSERLKELIA